MPIPNIKLGQKVRCTVTGFTGIAIAKEEHKNGCVQYAVKPRVKKQGEMPEAVCIDVEDLEVIGQYKKPVVTNTSGPKERARRQDSALRL